MKNFLKVSLMTAVVAGLMIVSSASSAKADPFLTGAYSISGNLIPVIGTTPTDNLLLATGLDFVPNGSGPTPGVPGPFIVNSANGDFSSLMGMSGLIKDFTFVGAGSPGFPAVPIAAFQVVDGVTFDLTTVSIVFRDENNLTLAGTGVFHKTGFADTVGIFRFSAQGADSSFSFSASESAVPEPASMLLLGTGLLGAAGAFRRRFKAQS